MLCYQIRRRCSKILTPQVFRITRCILLQSANGYALFLVPDEFKDENMCLTAVQSSWLALEFVKEKHAKLQYMLAAVIKMVCFFVPDEFKDENMCLTALKQNPKKAIKFIPENLDNETFYLKAIQKSSKILPHIPAKYLTQDFYIKSVKVNGLSLEHVPKKLKDYNICLDAIKTNGYAVLYVPTKIKCYEIYLAAVKNNGEVLYHVPHKFRYKQICIEALKQNPKGAIPCIQKNLHNEEFYLKAIQQNTAILDTLNAHYKIPEFCKKAKEISQSPKEYIEEDDEAISLSDFMYTNNTNEHIELINHDVSENVI